MGTDIFVGEHRFIHNGYSLLTDIRKCVVKPWSQEAARLLTANKGQSGKLAFGAGTGAEPGARGQTTCLALSRSLGWIPSTKKKKKLALCILSTVTLVLFIPLIFALQTDSF